MVIQNLIKHLDFGGKIVYNAQKLEKGKPPEKAGRKVTGLSLGKCGDRVAELPGGLKKSSNPAYLLQRFKQTINWN
jgi:hypothetical protein